MEDQFDEGKELNSLEEQRDVSEVVATQLLGRIRRGRDVLRACEKGLTESLKVDGKTLKEWAKELTVELPEDPDDISGLEQAQNRISNAFQKAEYLTAIFELQSTAISHCHESGYAQRYVSEMESHKGEKIAAEKLRQMVLNNNEIDASLSAAQAAGLICEFFKKIVKGLEEARKGIENRARFLAIRDKLNRM